MDAEDRERKKAWRAGERSAAKKAFPLSDADLESLFAHVNRAIDETVATIPSELPMLGFRSARWLAIQSWGGYGKTADTATARSSRTPRTTGIKTADGELPNPPLQTDRRVGRFAPSRTGR